MFKVRFTADGSDCHTNLYQTEPDKYRGQLICLECKARAWFVKESSNKTAYFAAHHVEGCNASSVLLVAEDDELPAQDQHDLKVDLDKSRGGSMYVAEKSPDYIPGLPDWDLPNARNKLGSGEFPTNKSLRQLLNHLCNNPDFANKQQTIKIVADSGRVLLDGVLQSLLRPVTAIQSADSGDLMLFWGRINNVNERNNALWLNMGNYQTEPSIIVEDELKDELLDYFRLKDFDELQGADFILLGHCGQSNQHKYVLRFSFCKYIAFRAYRTVEKQD